jgi:hypothetical protein
MSIGWTVFGYYGEPYARSSGGGIVWYGGIL